MSDLLISPRYLRNEGYPIEKVGRSFFREDLGFGQIETHKYPRSPISFGHIKLFDLSGLDIVTLETGVPPELLEYDEIAKTATEHAVETALRNIPGLPRSIYQP